VDWALLSSTALRAVTIYAFVLLLIRLLGKRTVGNLTAFDLLVAVMLGELVDEIIYGDVPFAQGLVGLTTIAAMHLAVSWLSYSSPAMDRILEGEPVEVVRDGRLLAAGLRSERMSEKEVLAELRRLGVKDLREVRVALVEDDGTISVLWQDWANPAQRADVSEEHRRTRERALAGADSHSTLPDEGWR
jgi:uncharacterized membrane protein YcaP (DUF421 family)